MHRLASKLFIYLLPFFTACEIASVDIDCALGDPACNSLLPLLASMHAQSGSTAPDSIAGLQLWLEADTLSATAGDTVATWPDLSNNSFDATQASGTERPTFVANAFGSRPALRFDGSATGDHLTLGSNFIFSTGDGITILAVVRSDFEDDGADFVLDFGNFGNNGYGLIYSSNADGVAENIGLYGATGSGGLTQKTAFQQNTTDGSVIAGRIKFAPHADQHFQYHANGRRLFDERSFTLSQLTAVEVATNANRAASSGPVTIGGTSKTFSDTARYFGGDIGGVLVYDRALGDGELAGVQCYLAEKYSIGLSNDC